MGDKVGEVGRIYIIRGFIVGVVSIDFILGRCGAWIRCEGDSAGRRLGVCVLVGSEFSFIIL